MFSAYTIRKVLPRLLIAVILIQLSWWITIQLININNDIAHGLEGLIYAPFGGVDAFSLNGIIEGSGNSSGGFAGFFSAAAAGTLVGFTTLGAGTAVGIAALAGSAVLGILVAVFTLVLRQAVLIFLVVIAPLAIVAWVLPGTEKFWKLWWESFFKLLLMYPLILLMIATGRVFAYVSANSGQSSLLTFVMMVLGMFGPLFMIPATLKLAGTAFSTLTAAVNSKNKGVFDRLRGVRDNQAKQNSAYRMDRANRRMVARRADLQNRWQDAASDTNRNAASRFLLGRASGMVGGRNIQAAASAMQAKVGKEINDQIATGRDEEIRALTVNKLTSRSRIGSNGRREYETLAGAWVSEAAVDAGHKRWGNDRYAQQAALSYEMRKAATDEQVENVGKNYKRVAMGAGGWGMTENQARGALIGAGFENQNTHLEFKHMDLDGNVNGAKLAEEAYEKKGNYALSQMSAHTFKQLGVAHAAAKRSGDTATMQKIESVAETFMSRYGGGGASRIANVTDDGQPIAAPDPAALASAAQAQAAGRALTPAEQQAQYLQQQNYQVNSSGSGHVAEAARQLAVDVGVYRPLDMSTDTHSATGDGTNPRHN